MKGLIWNCKNVSWKNTNDDLKEVVDCLLVYVCLETDDQQEDVKHASRRIIQINRKRYERKKVVLFPFAHLSNDILESAAARLLIHSLGSSLKKKVEFVELMQFSEEKEIKIHLLPKNNDVTYFSY